MRPGERPGAHVRATVAILAWPGIPLPAVTLFGLTFWPTVTLGHEVHARRQQDGNPPELDEDVLAVWEWPEYPDPASVVSLTGALFSDTGRRLRSSITAASRWRGFGPSAVLTGRELPADHPDRLECALWGVGLVTTGGGNPTLIVPADPSRPATARDRNSADRWVEEHLYRHALQTGWGQI